MSETAKKQANHDRNKESADCHHHRARKKRTERSKHFWYTLCLSYTSRYSHMSMASFLRSEASGPEIDGKKSSVNSFASYLKRFKNKDLQPKKSKRVHISQYKEVETRLVHYIDLRAKLFKNDGKGLSWQIMQLKCDEWAKDESDAKYKHFTASTGFIANVLKSEERYSWD